MYLERDNQQVETLNKKNLELEVNLTELKTELEDKKLTFRVLQERLGKNIHVFTLYFWIWYICCTYIVLVYTTNEADKYKLLGQNLIKKFSSFLRESSEDFEMENDMEKFLDVLKAENSALAAQLEHMVILIINFN